MMRSSTFALIALGAMVLILGFLGLLNATQVLLVDWHFVGSILGSLVAMSLGVWIVLCALECYAPRGHPEKS